MKDESELRRRSREVTETIFTKGLYKTFIEITIMTVIGGLGCIYSVLLAWEHLIKPMVEKGWIN